MIERHIAVSGGWRSFVSGAVIPNNTELGAFPNQLNIGLNGVGLVEASMPVFGGTGGFTGSTVATVEEQVINDYIRVFDSAQVAIRRCKINGRVDIDSVAANLTLEDSVIDAGAWSNAAIGFQNLVINRCEIRGGVTAVNATRNVFIRDSLLHMAHLPATGDWHLGGFLSNGGHTISLYNCTIICNNPLNPDGGGPSGTAQLYGDFEVLHNITFDHCFFAATTGAYTTSFGYDPGWVESGGLQGKQYGAETHHITVKNCVWERGPGGIYKGGTVATTSSFPSLDPNSVWLNNTWDDGTPIDSDA